MIYVEGPRFYRVSDTNQGAKVLVTAYILVCNTILSVLARGSIKVYSARKWAWDDTAITVAGVLAMGHVGSMAAAYEFGMGQRMAAGGMDHWSSLMRSFYASNVLYIATIVLAKLSILLFIRRLTPAKRDAKICWFFAIIIGLWGASTLLAWLFGCGMPKPWKYDSTHCISLGTITRTTAIIDMATDLALVALPVYLFGNLKYQRSGRATIITVFSLRALIIIPDIMRLLSIHAAFEVEGADITWSSVPFQIWTTVALHYSVISASIPCVRPLLRNLESGLLNVSMQKHPRLQGSGEDGGKSFMLMTLSHWSVMRGVKTENESFSTDTTRQGLRRSKLSCHGRDSGDSRRQNSINSEVDFSRRLHPEIAEHRTKIQAMRTFPQYEDLTPRPVKVLKSDHTGMSGTSLQIHITEETTIRFEQDGKEVQKLRTKTGNVAS